MASGGPALAQEVAQAWISSAHAAFVRTGFMYEKYHSNEIGIGGSGGEYEPQVKLPNFYEMQLQQRLLSDADTLVNIRSSTNQFYCIVHFFCRLVSAGRMALHFACSRSMKAT